MTYFQKKENVPSLKGGNFSVSGHKQQFVGKTSQVIRKSLF
jgi:hypothetical protein